MKIETRKFRIGELADKLAIERFVIRFWEKEFGIKAYRSEGGQRFYDEKDFKKFATIKELLYDKGFTIAGAKKFLKQPKAVQKAETKKETTIVASQRTTMEPDLELQAAKKKAQEADEMMNKVLAIAEQMTELRKKLVKLRELL